MIAKKIEDAFNAQINAEIYSSYLYLCVQAQEEMTHAMKFYDHIIERDGTVALAAIDGPPMKWKGVKAVIAETLEHEQKVTGLINDLMDLSMTENDHAGRMFLQWFVTEQVEEEATAMEILGKLEIAGDSAGGLYLLDKEMAGRVFTPPAAAE
ncbi:MAG: ferritin [Planctomycetota bacterium]|jgi:ferritin